LIFKLYETVVLHFNQCFQNIILVLYCHVIIEILAIQIVHDVVSVSWPLGNFIIQWSCRGRFCQRADNVHVLLLHLIVHDAFENVNLVRIPYEHFNSNISKILVNINIRGICQLNELSPIRCCREIIKPIF